MATEALTPAASVRYSHGAATRRRESEYATTGVFGTYKLTEYPTLKDPDLALWIANKLSYCRYYKRTLPQNIFRRRRLEFFGRQN